MKFDVNNKKNLQDDDKSIITKWYYRIQIHWKCVRKSRDRNQEYVRIRKNSIMWELIWSNLFDLILDQTQSLLERRKNININISSLFAYFSFLFHTFIFILFLLFSWISFSLFNI